MSPAPRPDVDEARAVDAALAAAVDHPEIRALAAALAARPGAVADVAPTDAPPRRAAVAAVLRVAPGETAPSLLLVRRAEYPGDPWSGHVALPGGRAEPGDTSLWDTAARETREETGLDLQRHARRLGTLDELYPRTPSLPPIVVRPYVAVTGATDALQLSAELASAFWMPLARLADPAVDRHSTVQVRGQQIVVPSFVHETHTIWGMTERIIRQLIERLGARTLQA